MRWVKLHDSILEWKHFGEGNVLRLWLYLLLTANHEEREWNDRTIKVGQKLTSMRRLAEQLELSVNTVQDILKKLQASGELTVESDRKKGTLITINNYSKYQSVSKSDTQSNTPTDTLSNTLTDTPTDTKQERNNNAIISKEEKNIRSCSSMQQQQPQLEDIQKEIIDKGYRCNAVDFMAYNETRGWKVKNWRAALYRWNQRELKDKAPLQPKVSTEVHDVTNEHLKKYDPSPTAMSWEEYEKLKGQTK